MIEIDGQAIPLEPGKHYLVLFDERYTTDDMKKQFMDWAAAAHIGYCAMVLGNLSAVRVVNIERPETPQLGEALDRLIEATAYRIKDGFRYQQHYDKADVANELRTFVRAVRPTDPT